MSFVKQAWEKLAVGVIDGLNRRNMTAQYCATTQEAVAAAMSFVTSESKVSWGGSHTLEQIGLMEALKESGCTMMDRYTAKTPEETKKIFQEILFSDVYFMSSNAITADGMLVNVDGRGNRVASLIFGPEKVVIIAGMNKVMPDIDSAMKRVRNQAAPPNCLRLGLNTPCSHTGKCSDCQSPDSICCQFVVTRRSRQNGRIHVILVGEELGF